MYVCVYMYIYTHVYIQHVCLKVTNLSDNVGDRGLIPGLGRPPGERTGNPLQFSCLEIPWTEEPGGLQSMKSQKSKA